MNPTAAGCAWSWRRNTRPRGQRSLVRIEDRGAETCSWTRERNCFALLGLEVSGFTRKCRSGGWKAAAEWEEAQQKKSGRASTEPYSQSPTWLLGDTWDRCADLTTFASPLPGLARYMHTPLGTEDGNQDQPTDMQEGNQEKSLPSWASHFCVHG